MATIEDQIMLRSPTHADRVALQSLANDRQHDFERHARAEVVEPAAIPVITRNADFAREYNNVLTCIVMACAISKEFAQSQSRYTFRHAALVFEEALRATAPNPIRAETNIAESAVLARLQWCAR